MDELLLSLVSRRLSEYSLELEGASALKTVVPEEPVTLTMLHPHGSQQVSALLTSTPTLTRALRAQTETHGQCLFLRAEAKSRRGPGPCMKESSW